MAMYGNGATTGATTIHQTTRETLVDLVPAIAVSCAGEAISTMRNTAVAHATTGTPRAIVPRISDSASAALQRFANEDSRRTSEGRATRRDDRGRSPSADWSVAVWGEPASTT